MSDMSIERVDVERPDSVHAGGLVITKELIRQRLGMELAVIFPYFESDAAGIVCHGEELERIGELCGYNNVIASLYFDEGKLLLGIFVREGSIPGDVIDSSVVIPEITTPVANDSMQLDPDAVREVVDRLTPQADLVADWGHENGIFE